MDLRTKTDPIATAYEAAEKRLTEWGIICRRNSDYLGLPRMSGIHAMIEHVRREDRLRKGVRKKNVRQVHREWKKGDATDAKEAAEAFRYFDRYLTAQGKQPRPFKILRQAGINSRVMQIDGIVARMPQWMQATIIRSYQYGQPDENACRDLRMRKRLYRQHREAAVEYVADRLAELEIGGKE